MNDRTVIHSTFSLERVYDAPAGRVFAAWADPAAHHVLRLAARLGLDGGPHVRAAAGVYLV